MRGSGRAVGRFRRGVHGRFRCLSCTPVVCISTIAGRELSAVPTGVGRVDRGRGHHVSSSLLGSILVSTITRGPAPASGNHHLGVCCVARMTMGPPAFIIFIGSPRLLRFSCRHFLRGEVHSSFSFRKAPFRLVTERGGWVAFAGTLGPLWSLR